MAELVELPPDVDSDLDVQLPSDVDDDIFPGYHEEGDPPRQEGDPPPLPEDWDSSAERLMKTWGLTIYNRKPGLRAVPSGILSSLHDELGWVGAHTSSADGIMVKI